MKKIWTGLHKFAAAIAVIMMLSTCFGFCIFAAAKSDEQNYPRETYSKDGWSVSYDPNAFWVYEGREEGDTVRFHYCGDENVTANMGIEYCPEAATIDEAMEDIRDYSFECVANTTFHGNPAVSASTGLRTWNNDGEISTCATTFIIVNHNGRIYRMDIYITDEANGDNLDKVNDAIISLMDSVTFSDLPAAN